MFGKKEGGRRKECSKNGGLERGEVFFDRKRLCGGGLSRYVLIGFSASGVVWKGQWALSLSLRGLSLERERTWLTRDYILLHFLNSSLPSQLSVHFYSHALSRTMWRDRISGQSTPSSVNRAPSLPRRSSSQLSRGPYSNRPGATSKTSSTPLLLTPSDSTTSLSGGARGPNGTGLRQTSGQRPRPATVEDPIEVLNGIIGISESGKGDSESSTQPESKPAELIETIEFDGLSLEEFVAKADVAPPTRRTKRSEVNAQTIRQFEQERDKFQDLHTSITGCDDVSKSVELYLNDFQTELGAVSAEIETLQTRSTHLNAMLENRRNVERLLGPAVEEISISPKTVRTIVEGPMDENWVRALNEIDARTTSIEAKASSSSGFKAIEDVRPLLVDVKNKVRSICRASGGIQEEHGLTLELGG